MRGKTGGRMPARRAPRVALATATDAVDLDPDLGALASALEVVGCDAVISVWTDASVDWAAMDAVVLRSTWDYPRDPDRFLAWCEAVDRVTTLWNPIDLVRWNVDKRYLVELAGEGFDVVPTRVVDPGTSVSVVPFDGDVVVKPAIGAGSIDAARHRDHDHALTHVQRLVDAGRAALVQPYVDAIDLTGELDVVFIDGRLSHAFGKGALLTGGRSLVGGLFVAEELAPMTPPADAIDAAAAVVEHVAGRFGTPLYARVDLVHDGGRWLLLELELVEPSLNHHLHPPSAQRLAEVVRERLHDLHDDEGR